MEVNGGGESFELYASRSPECEGLRLALIAQPHISYDPVCPSFAVWGEQLADQINYLSNYLLNGGKDENGTAETFKRPEIHGRRKEIAMRWLQFGFELRERNI